MPSSRRLKLTTLAVGLTLCIIYYLTTGASQTHTSPFYTRTAAALAEKKTAAERADTLAEEQQRLERVARLKKEHEVAMSEANIATPITAAGPAQDPLAADAKSVTGPRASEKGAAGRKTTKDGKVVEGKPASDMNDGVAKVGNVAPKISDTAADARGGEGEEETEEEHRVEVALNEILKRGPIIVFSKTFCPFSKKAKHILLDLYTISPPPYVVELDQHELGPGLQAALGKKTGRRTVPNVLINGKSIGGGDDVEALHVSDKLAETVQSMGGKRIVKVMKNEVEKKTEMMFRS